jgi:hypothetical protein
MPGALRMLAAVFGGIQHLHLKGAKRSPKRPHERISRPSWGSGRHRSGGTGHPHSRLRSHGFQPAKRGDAVSRAAMRSWTAVRRRLTEAAAMEGDHR